MDQQDLEKSQDNDYSIPSKPLTSSIPFATEDIIIPPHLLQATGHTSSTQDTRKSISWQSRPSNRLNSRSTACNPRIAGTQSSHISDDVAIGPGEQTKSAPGTSPLSTKPDKSETKIRGPSVVHWSTTDASSFPFHSATNPFSTRNNSSDGESSQDHFRSQSVSTQEPQTADLEAADSFHERHDRRGTLRSVVDTIIPHSIRRRTFASISYVRRSSMWQTYENAKKRGKELQRNKYLQWAFEYVFYTILVLFVYFVLVGVPLWNGAVWWLWWAVANRFVIAGGFSITIAIAFFYAFAPLLILFEKDPPPADYPTETKIQPNVKDTALMIPCYKSAGLIAATLEAALKIFPPSHIFVIANGNSPTPLDNTEEVCRPYGVNHIWSPIGSKIVAQFVGCYAAKSFKNVLLIDDDCALPNNFPVVTERLVGKVLCIGYTIKSVGPNSSKGNLCQQAQDLEYKLSGIQREFAGRVGSATFPHGAISLWDRELLVKTFHEHPGFSVSEDWFFGHVARKLGSRIKMCSQVFVETETPTSVFFSSGGSRGGFGEMTIFSQRFKRWNFFFVNGMYYNMAYIFGSWKLGWWEIGAKLFVFQEVYETLLYLLTPFILPISFIVRPSFAGILLAATIVMYLINVIIFNEVHLRRKGERLGWVLLYVYYLPYKMVLAVVNVASCYWAIWKYARYFAKRHPMVIEDEKAVEVVIRLEEEGPSFRPGFGRRLTVVTINSGSRVTINDHETVSPLHRIHTSNVSPRERSNSGIPPRRSPTSDVSPRERATSGVAEGVTRPEPVHPRMGSLAVVREGILEPDYFFNPRASALVVTEQEPTYAKMSTPAMEQEGIAATDYFYSHQDRDTSPHSPRKGKEK